MENDVKLPEEGAQAVAAEGAAEGAAPEEAAEKSKRKVAVAIALAIAAIIAAGCAVAALWVGKAHLTVTAEGYDPATSTPVVIEVFEGDQVGTLSDDDASNDPEPLAEQTLNANQETALDGVSAKGTYTVRVKAAPVLSDGTSFKKGSPMAFGLGFGDSHAEIALDKVDPATATPEELAEAAAASGDEAKAAAAKSAAAAAQSKASSSGSSSSSSGSGSVSGGTSSGGSSPSSGGGSSSGESSSGGSSEPSKPAHTHSWAPQYSTTTVNDYDYRIVCLECSQQFTSGSAAGNHSESTGHSGTTTKKVVVGSHTEQVLTGYRCSGCGASK